MRAQVKLVSIGLNIMDGAERARPNTRSGDKGEDGERERDRNLLAEAQILSRVQRRYV